MQDTDGNMLHRRLSLGSLFSGSGGFELGGLLSEIEPRWNSEIEPFPIRVTTKRFPWLQHLGDISGIDGSKIEPVDIITFGSPCTDMSVAGKRAGLDGKQSVLFYEAIRIIKEMRQATDGRYPRYIVWENVPGAFSSNNGEDFKAVIEAVVGIVSPETEVPAPEKNGWPYADVLVGDGWSVAYRTVDAQYFGVAQRRRRIYLVADFGSERAGEVLFEREGVSRDFTPCIPAREGTAESAENRSGEPSIILNVKGGAFKSLLEDAERTEGDEDDSVMIEMTSTKNTVIRNGICPTLTARMGSGGNQVNAVCEKVGLSIPYGICSSDSNSMKSPNPHSGIYKAGTSRTLDQSGGNPSCNQGGIAVVTVQGSMIGREDKNGPQGSGVSEDVSFTLNTADRHAIAYAMTTGCFSQIHKEKAATLTARDYKDMQIVNRPQYIVRRLTPTECARLQGFPDWWCDGLEIPEPQEEDIDWWAEVFETHRRIIGKSSKQKSRKQIVKWLRYPYSDSAAYRMWGNGICLQCAIFVFKGIMQLLEDVDGSTQHTD